MKFLTSFVNGKFSLANVNAWLGERIKAVNLSLAIYNLYPEFITTSIPILLTISVATIVVVAAAKIMSLLILSKAEIAIKVGI